MENEIKKDARDWEQEMEQLEACETASELLQAAGWQPLLPDENGVLFHERGTNLSDGNFMTVVTTPGEPEWSGHKLWFAPGVTVPPEGTYIHVEVWKTTGGIWELFLETPHNPETGDLFEEGGEMIAL